MPSSPRTADDRAEEIIDIMCAACDLCEKDALVLKDVLTLRGWDVAAVQWLTARHVEVHVGLDLGRIGRDG